MKLRITNETAAIMAVHLHGHPCDMDPLLELAGKHELRIIEDCAQAHGAEYQRRRVGCIGDIGCFSFYPGKNLGAYGDGGAIITNNDEVAQRCRRIANHGRIAKHDHHLEGRNSRLDGLQAAILDVKLKHLDAWIEHRNAIADSYLEGLQEVPNITLPVRQNSVRHAYHLFVIRHQKRDDLKARLMESGVPTGIHYPVALPKLNAFAYLDQSEFDAFAWDAGKLLLSIPIGEHVTNAISHKIIKSIIRCA